MFSNSHWLWQLGMVKCKESKHEELGGIKSGEVHNSRVYNGHHHIACHIHCKSECILNIHQKFCQH